MTLSPNLLTLILGKVSWGRLGSSVLNNDQHAHLNKTIKGVKSFGSEIIHLLLMETSHQRLFQNCIPNIKILECSITSPGVPSALGGPFL
jgi:hypothetical protein